MESKKRRKYTREFKQEAVRLAQKAEQATAVARDLGIQPNMLYRWQQEFLTEEGESFRGNGKRAQAAQEAWVQEKRIRELEEENTILKKALSIFSRGVK